MMIDKENLYPLRFHPYYKHVMWGGHNLEKILHREIPASDSPDPVGESWEISDRPDVQSVVANGDLAGATIHELIEAYGSDLLGTDFHGGRFPLLIKVEDAGKRLSLQVHPGENACRILGGNAQPKTEMWYIIHADKGAKIIAGLRPDTTRLQFLATAETTECEKTLQIFDSLPGDAYFINAGKVHAIGSGNLLLEIQQNSDTTYRISDWGRVGSDGKPRQLHLEEAKVSIDYNDRSVARIAGVRDVVNHNRKFPIIRNCPFFRVEDLRLAEVWTDTTASGKTFHVLSSINGTVRVGRPEAEITMEPGSTCLIPACFGDYRITPEPGTFPTVLKTTLS